MKLYFAPGACSLAPHIALQEAGIPFTPVKVDLRSHKLADGTDYYALNPKGYVPMLELDDGTRLTEAAVIMATVPEPWATRTSEAMKNGTRTPGRLRSAIASASASPTPESRRTWPRAPPAPVIRMIRPAEPAASAIQWWTCLRGVQRGRST